MNNLEPLAVYAGMGVRGVLVTLLLWTLVSSMSSFCADLALVHAKIYPSPSEPPIENGAILVHEGRILVSLTARAVS